MLSDGLPHTRKELRTVLWDPMADLITVNVHVSAIRKKLKDVGEDVVCVMLAGYKLAYRHVRLLSSAVDGKT
jgi:DNA-binding response OmpR family regulator